MVNPHTSLTTVEILPKYNAFACTLEISALIHNYRALSTKLQDARG